MASTPCTILLEEDVAVDPRQYGDRVAALFGISRLEARLLVRRGRGIFLENVPEEDARRLAGELLRNGIRSRVIPKDRIPPLPRPMKVTRLEGGGEALSYRTPDGDAAVPWEAIFVASCGLVARPESGDFFSHVPFVSIPPLRRLEERDREIVRENLILKISTPPSGEPPKQSAPASVFEEIEQHHAAQVRVYFDLLTEDLGAWLRIPMEEAAYAHAAGQVRMGLSWGFQLLADDLRKKCPSAITEITAKLLEGSEPRALVFPRLEEFTRYTAWTALRRHLGPATEAPPPPSPR